MKEIYQKESLIFSPHLWRSACEYPWGTHTSLPWRQPAWKMKWQLLGLILGVLSSKALRRSLSSAPQTNVKESNGPQSFSTPHLCPYSLPTSFPFSPFPSIPYCMSSTQILGSVAKPSSPTLDPGVCTNHSASQPQPACITIKFSCLACLTLLSTLCGYHYYYFHFIAR